MGQPEGITILAGCTAMAGASRRPAFAQRSRSRWVLELWFQDPFRPRVPARAHGRLLLPVRHPGLHRADMPTLPVRLAGPRLLYPRARIGSDARSSGQGPHPPRALLNHAVVHGLYPTTGWDADTGLASGAVVLSVVCHLVVVEGLPFSLENGSKSTPLHFLISRRWVRGLPWACRRGMGRGVALPPGTLA